jgi:ribose/xylose/arabinose/galactoside ABC-type transport system permease subunit
MTQTTNQPPQSTGRTVEYQVPQPYGGPSWTTIINAVGPLLGLALVYAFFAVFGPDTFKSQSTLMTMLNQTVVVGIAALGMTMVIIAGGIDLSVGSAVALVTTIVAYVVSAAKPDQEPMLEQYPLLWPLVAGLAGVGAGVVCGLISGTLITLLGVVPFIITLGLLLEFRGGAIGFAHEQKIDADLSWLNDLIGKPPPYLAWMQLSPGIWMMLLLALLVAGILRYTRFGRHVFAIGSNEQTARLCGIAVNRVKILVYAFAGMMTGVAGVMQFSRLSVGDPTVAVGLELDVIAAVVIGGGSLSGGEGSVLGTLVGALIMTVIKVGCAQMGLSNWVQMMVTGVIIIIAVTLDRLRHRKTS